MLDIPGQGVGFERCACAAELQATAARESAATQIVRFRFKGRGISLLSNKYYGIEFRKYSKNCAYTEVFSYRVACEPVFRVSEGRSHTA